MVIAKQVGPWQNTEVWNCATKVYTNNLKIGVNFQSWIGIRLHLISFCWMNGTSQKHSVPHPSSQERRPKLPWESSHRVASPHRNIWCPALVQYFLWGCHHPQRPNGPDPVAGMEATLNCWARNCTSTWATWATGCRSFHSPWVSPLHQCHLAKVAVNRHAPWSHCIPIYWWFNLLICHTFESHW